MPWSAYKLSWSADLEKFIQQCEFLQNLDLAIQNHYIFWMYYEQGKILKLAVFSLSTSSFAF